MRSDFKSVNERASNTCSMKLAGVFGHCKVATNIIESLEAMSVLQGLTAFGPRI